MVYEETVIQKITYDKDDVISWVRKFAALQLGINMEQIKPEDLQISIPMDDVITVIHTKQTSNQRAEESINQALT